MKKNYDISIIIVTYEVKRLAIECLVSVLHSTKRIKTEIIVIDNASKDGTVQALKNHLSGIRLLANEKNIGFGKACNQGADLATGKVLLFLNPDTIINEGAIESLVTFLGNNPNVAIVGPQLAYPNGCKQASAFRFITPSVYSLNFTLLGRCWHKLYVALNGRPHSLSFQLWPTNIEDAYFEPDYVSGSCLAIRKVVFDELGGFPIDSFMYNDDSALAWRAKQQGYKIVSLNSVSIIHKHQQSRKANLRKSLICRQTAKLIFAKNNYPKNQYISMRIIIFLEQFIRLPIYFFLSLMPQKKDYKEYLIASIEAMKKCYSGIYSD